MKRAVQTILVAAAILAPSTSPPAGALGMESVWLGSPFMEGWVPTDAETVRGVLIMNGWPNDARWHEAATYWNFAILRINTDQYPGSKVKAVVHGLRELAERTGHPELNHVPIVASGFSRYSPSAPAFMAAFPDRALCFMNGNGGGPTVRDDGGKQGLIWQETPSLGLQNEWENIFSGGDKTRLLSRWWRRGEKNLTAAAIHWRVYHAPKTFADLGIVFVDQVIQARIPKDWDPAKGSCKLKSIKHSQGWLGSHKGWRVPVEKIFETDNQNAEIAPAEKFQGDPERASWLISEELAWNWRAFSSRYPKARVVEPGHSNLVLHQDTQPAPLGHLETGVRAGQPFRAAAISHVANMKKLEFFANTVPLGEATTFTGGQSALGNTMQAVGRIEATINEPGVYGLMVRYTTADGESGWSRPMPLVVWPDGEDSGQ
jgi:hypothetical protein